MEVIPKEYCVNNQFEIVLGLPPISADSKVCLYLITNNEIKAMVMILNVIAKTINFMKRHHQLALFRILLRHLAIKDLRCGRSHMVCG
jgi:hypothetical protein